LRSVSELQETSIFARKNYFYPDLPKGYQISQYDRPFSANGTLTIMTAERDPSGRASEWKPMTIGIERMHLEEDAGRTSTKVYRMSTSIRTLT
jgi:aspartyl-tRNA(Asn)/glutamyl-tRNA(Gln) amidotransferase subunit B